MVKRERKRIGMLTLLQDVTKPIATVPIIAIGIIRSGFSISSAKWVAQSRQAKAQFVLVSPMINAIPFCDQPVLFTKVALNLC